MDGMLLDSPTRSVRAPRTSREVGSSPMIIVQRGPASIPNGPVPHLMDSTARSTMGGNKKKGFSSTAPRFHTKQPASSTPPSTKYDPHAHLRALQNHPESTSKKGSGTFASRSKRFRKQKMVKAGEPASYNLPSAFHTSNTNALQYSASMGKRIVPDASANEKHNSGSDRRRRGGSIGPHSYNTRPSWHASSPAASAFRSRTTRLGIPAPASSNPGPGTYNLDPSTSSSSSFASNGTVVAAAAAALSRRPHTTSNSSNQQQQPGGSGGSGGVGTSSFRSTVKRDIGTRARTAHTPGPGSYDVSPSSKKTQQQQRPFHALPARITGPAVRLADTVAGRGSEALMYSQYGQLHPDASPARLAERRPSDSYNDYADDVYSREHSRNSMRSTGRHWTRSARRRLLSSSHPTSTPGPGAYEVALDTGGPLGTKRLPAATSAFKSSSARTELDQKLRRVEQEALPSPSNYHQPHKRLPAKFQHSRGILKRSTLARTLQAARMAQAQAAAGDAHAAHATTASSGEDAEAASRLASSHPAHSVHHSHHNDSNDDNRNTSRRYNQQKGGEGAAKPSDLIIGAGHAPHTHNGNRTRHVYPNGQQRPRPRGSASLVLSSPPRSAMPAHAMARHAAADDGGRDERTWGGGVVTGRAASAS